VLELSLADAVQRTLDNNADIAVERYNPQDSDYNVRQLKGYYEPYVISTLGQRSNTQPASNAFAGAAAPLTRTLTYNFGAFQSLPTGGTFEADFNNNRQTTNSVFSAFNPSFASNFNLSLSQPLLRNFSIDSTRYQIKVAKKNQEISDVQFRQSVVNTVANVKSAYYDLIYAIDNLSAQRKSLGLAQQLLEENRIKVRVGTMAPLDVVAAQSEVAGREANVIAAEAAVNDNIIFNVSPTLGDHVMCSDISLAGQLGRDWTVEEPATCAPYDAEDAATPPVDDVPLGGVTVP